MTASSGGIRFTSVDGQTDFIAFPEDGDAEAALLRSVDDPLLRDQIETMLLARGIYDVRVFGESQPSGEQIVMTAASQDGSSYGEVAVGITSASRFGPPRSKWGCGFFLSLAAGSLATQYLVRDYNHHSVDPMIVEISEDELVHETGPRLGTWLPATIALAAAVGAFATCRPPLPPLPNAPEGPAPERAPEPEPSPEGDRSRVRVDNRSILEIAGLVIFTVLVNIGLGLAGRTMGLSSQPAGMPFVLDGKKGESEA